MLAKWKQRRLRGKAENLRTERQKDYKRPVRVCERLHARVLECLETGNLDRADVLANRMKRVRDYQIRTYGH